MIAKPLCCTLYCILYDFSVTVKVAPNESVIRTGQPYTWIKAENEAWFYSKVTVSSCAVLPQYRRKTHYLVLQNASKIHNCI